MSKIYEALKKAEREKEVRGEAKEPQPSPAGTSPPPKVKEYTLSPAAAEEYRKMSNTIKTANPNRQVKILLILSSVHGEGTSSVCAQFAQSLVKGSQEKVLLVDANLRRPVLHDLFGLRRKSGFVELLQAKLSASQVIKETKIPGLFVVTAGEPTENPPRLLESPRLGEALTEWKQNFATVILDSSPALAYADAVILGRLTDGVVLVVHAGRTRREVIQKTQNTLDNAKVPFLGVVLNKRQHVIPKRLYKRL